MSAVTMSTTKKQIAEKQKLRKMSKAQLQLTAMKKKQCDTRALAIVEQLLESHVNPEWLLQTLGFISKSHMEDVIEERAIVKLCGYVLCSNQLTVIIRQRYHISVRKNKVYDVSRRKNFCSSSCYGAANYLLEQMLESPLWLRKKEDIPIFQILPLNSKSTQCGDEIDVVGIKFWQNMDSNDDSKESTEHSVTEQMKKDMVSNVLNEKEDVCSFHLLNGVTEKDEKAKEVSVNMLSCETYPLEQRVNPESENCDSKEFTKRESNCVNIQQVDVNLENLEIEIAGYSENILHLHKHNEDVENKNVNLCDNDEALQPQLDGMSNDQSNTSERLRLQSVEIGDNTNNENEKRLQLDEISNSPNDGKMMQSYKMCSSNNTVISSASTYGEYRKIEKTNRINRSKRYKPRETNSAEVKNDIYQLTTHVEQSVREWITRNTLCLLMGEADEKNQLLKKLTQHDRYQQLCKKLNRLQLLDKKEDHVDLKRNELKPLSHFSVLQEDGKEIELKVRAFYEGRMTITPSEDSATESESKDNNEPVLPLTAAHAPNALRRRIFLDNLNKILPDLMRALTINGNILTLAQYTYDNERYSLIKILISTFNLSAANIVFKNAEWTLVGLIIIKMLSLIDTQLQLLLRSKQALLYMSMILTTYKLDSNYLDRLIMEITNNVDTSSRTINDAK